MLRPSLLALALCGCQRDIELPPQIAAGEHINFYTDVDASVVCMDDLLAREDAFIERTAAFLGEDPPDPVDFVWNPVRDPDEPWKCPSLLNPGCYLHRQGDDLSVVISDSLSNHHELVHAVDIQTLGHDSHPTLGEGLAEYLGSLNQSPPRTDYADEFKQMLAASPEPDDYRLAMHFVGALFERHGVEKFLQLRAEMPEDASLEEFSTVFEQVIDQPLDDALTDMSAAEIRAIDSFPGCEDDTPAIAWSAADRVDAVLESTCGDPWFHGTGFTPGVPGFYVRYRLEIPQAGEYELAVEAVDGGPKPLRSFLTGCTFELLLSAIGSVNDSPARGTLQPGPHSLAITFPQGPEPRGAARLRLTRLGDP